MSTLGIHAAVGVALRWFKGLMLASLDGLRGNTTVHSIAKISEVFGRLPHFKNAARRFQASRVLRLRQMLLLLLQVLFMLHDDC